jgi:hypothetical protein
MERYRVLEVIDTANVTVIFTIVGNQTLQTQNLSGKTANYKPERHLVTLEISYLDPITIVKSGKFILLYLYNADERLRFIHRKD